MSRGIRAIFGQVPLTMPGSVGQFFSQGISANLITSGTTLATKFVPSHGMLSYGWDSTGANNNGEFTALIKVAGTFKYWMGNYSWGRLQSAANDTSLFASTFIADFLQLQSQCIAAGVAPMYFGFFIRGNQYRAVKQGSQTTATASGLIPTFIRQCGGTLSMPDNSYTSTNFPRSPNPNEYGWWGSQYDSATSPAQYDLIVGAHSWHPVANAWLKNLYSQIASYPVPNIPGLPQYNGNTVDTHPLFLKLGTNDEFSYTFGGGGGFLGAPPNDLTVGVSPNYGNPYLANAYATVQDLLVSAQSYFPHTTIVSCLSYGVTDGGGSVSTGNMNLNLLTNLFYGKVGFSNADLRGNAFAPNYKASNMQQFVYGNTLSNMNANVFTTTVVVGGGTSYVNRMMVNAQIQGSDYSNGTRSGTLVRSPQAITDIYNSAILLGAQYIDWCFGDGYTTNPWTSYVAPTVATLGQPNQNFPTWT